MHFFRKWVIELNLHSVKGRSGAKKISLYSGSFLKPEYNDIMNV